MKRSILPCILVVLLGILSAAVGIGFVGGSNLQFPMKFLCNLLFILVPISDIWLVAWFYKKNPPAR